MLDAVVIGNSILDQVWSFSGPIVIDDKLIADGFGQFPGGQAANAAYTLGRLGLSVEFIGSFGDDPAGDFCKQTLVDAGVRLTASQTLYGLKSQMAAILVDGASGTRTIAIYRPPGLLLSSDTRITDLAQRARLVYVDGFEPAVQYSALKAAGEKGGVRLSDIEVVSCATRNLLGETDHLIISRSTALDLTGEQDIEVAVSKLSKVGPSTIIATDGGSDFVASRHLVISWHPVRPLTAVDPTGAGDAFRAGYAAAILSDLPFDDCLEFAVAAAECNLHSSGPRITSDETFTSLRNKLQRKDY